MFLIEHISGKYNFVQKARCKHCAFFYLHGSSVSLSRVCMCSLFRKYVIPESLACSSFVCNSKYKLHKSSVQLNLFDYAEKSVSSVSAVRDETAT